MGDQGRSVPAAEKKTQRLYAKRKQQLGFMLSDLPFPRKNLPDSQKSHEQLPVKMGWTCPPTPVHAPRDDAPVHTFQNCKPDPLSYSPIPTGVCAPIEWDSNCDSRTICQRTSESVGLAEEPTETQSLEMFLIVGQCDQSAVRIRSAGCIEIRVKLKSSVQGEGHGDWRAMASLEIFSTQPQQPLPHPNPL